jgi:hypothetical protein
MSLSPIAERKTPPKKGDAILEGLSSPELMTRGRSAFEMRKTRGAGAPRVPMFADRDD